VGYFSAFDINYFTVFSLSEHLALATEAVPFAIFFGIFVWFCVAQWDVLSIKELLREMRDESSKRKRWMEIGFWWAGPWIILVVAIRQEAWWVVVIAVFMIVYTVVTWFWPVVVMSRRAIFGYIALCALSVSYVVGYQVARSYASGAKLPLHRIMLKENTFDGRIIRAGERGLLAHRTEDGYVVLLRWDQVISISSKPIPLLVKPSGI